jgi:hypothetical protein
MLNWNWYWWPSVIFSQCILCFVVIMYSRVELKITSCWFIVEYPKKGVSLQAVSLASKSRVCPWKHFLHLTVRFFPHGSSNLSTHGKFKTNFLSDSLTIPKLISCPILLPSHCELISNIIILTYV